MDPVSFVASVVSLADATFNVVSYLNGLKEGGRGRLRLLNELTSFWMVLNLLKGRLDTLDLDHDEAWMQNIKILAESDGVFQQVESAVNKLAAKLEPKSGTKGLIQVLKWPLGKDEVDRAVSNIDSLKQTIDLVLGDANITLSKESRDNSKFVKSAVMDE